MRLRGEDKRQPEKEGGGTIKKKVQSAWRGFIYNITQFSAACFEAEAQAQ